MTRRVIQSSHVGAAGANHLQLLRNIERSEAQVPEAAAKDMSPACLALLHALLQVLVTWNLLGWS